MMALCLFCMDLREAETPARAGIDYIECMAPKKKAKTQTTVIAHVVPESSSRSLYRYGGTRRPRRHHLAGATQIPHQTARALHAWLRAGFNTHDAPRHTWARPPPRSVASQTFQHPNQHLHLNFCSTDLSATSTTSTSDQTIQFTSTQASATLRASARPRLHGRGTAAAGLLLPAHCSQQAHAHAHYRLTARRTTALGRE